MFSKFVSKKQGEKKSRTLDHDIEKGDHLIYWTHIALWPVQIHAICLASKKESITLIDFGLTSSKQGKQQKLTKEQNEIIENQDNDLKIIEEQYSKRFDNRDNVKLTLDAEDIAILRAIDDHRKMIQGRQRIQIRVITDDKELKKWHKVNYGKKPSTFSPMNWNKKKNENEACNDDDEVEDRSKGINANDGDAHSIKKNLRNNDEKNGIDNEEIYHDKSIIPPSDPRAVVLARVRYILNNPQILPPHNIFNSNSECIAVWCKTGRWSTIQASIFLHSTAAGNLKSTISLSVLAATTTVTTTTTVPAWGPLGWMGLTSTNTVTAGWLSLHPWAVPLLAGYGVVAIGAPIVMLMKAKKKWETTTQQLTDGFWSWAEPDIYVEAINNWSNIR